MQGLDNVANSAAELVAAIHPFPECSMDADGDVCKLEVEAAGRSAARAIAALVAGFYQALIDAGVGEQPALVLASELLRYAAGSLKSDSPPSTPG